MKTDIKDKIAFHAILQVGVQLWSHTWMHFGQAAKMTREKGTATARDGEGSHGPARPAEDARDAIGWSGERAMEWNIINNHVM